MPSENHPNNEPVPAAPQTNQNPANNTANPNDTISSAAIPEVKVPPSKTCHTVTCKTKRDGWDIAKLVAEFVGLGFLIAYTIYTAGIYCANKKAAEAAKKAADTADATLKLSTAELAVISFEPEIKGNISPSGGVTPNYFWVHYKIVVKNAGNVIAHNITVFPQEGSFGEHTPLTQRPDFKPLVSADSPPGVPTALAPTDTFTFDWDSGVPDEGKPRDQYWIFWIKVTVGYEDIFGPKKPLVYCMRYSPRRGKGNRYEWASCGVP